MRGPNESVRVLLNGVFFFLCYRFTFVRPHTRTHTCTSFSIILSLLRFSSSVCLFVCIFNSNLFHFFRVWVSELLENVYPLSEHTRQNFHFLQTNAGVSWSDEIQQFVGIFAHERFKMMASHVMPFQSIVIEIIQNWETWFVITFSVETENREDDFVIATCREKIEHQFSFDCYHYLPPCAASRLSGCAWP